MNTIEGEPEIIFLKDMLLVYYASKLSTEEITFIQKELENIENLDDLELIRPGHNLYTFIISALIYVESNSFKQQHDDNFLNYIYHMIPRLKYINTNNLP